MPLGNQYASHTLSHLQIHLFHVTIVLHFLEFLSIESFTVQLLMSGFFSSHNAFNMHPPGCIALVACVFLLLNSIPLFVHTIVCPFTS